MVKWIARLNSHLQINKFDSNQRRVTSTQHVSISSISLTQVFHGFYVTLDDQNVLFIWISYNLQIVLRMGNNHFLFASVFDSKNPRKGWANSGKNSRWFLYPNSTNSSKTWITLICVFLCKRRNMQAHIQSMLIKLTCWRIWLPLQAYGQECWLERYNRTGNVHGHIFYTRPRELATVVSIILNHLRVKKKPKTMLRFQSKVRSSNNSFSIRKFLPLSFRLPI